MGWLFALLLSIAMLALLGFGVNFVQNLERENSFVESQLQTAQMYDDAFSVRVKEVQRFRHDVKGLLQAVEFAEYVARGRTANMNDAEDSLVTPTSGFPLIDAVLQLKQRQCSQSQVSFSCAIDNSVAERAQEFGIAEADICAIVQNLLENAYEESLKVDLAVGRTIGFRLSDCESYLMVEVQNRTAETAVPTFQTTKTESGQHGVGLRVVDEAARKYGGITGHDFDPDTQLLTMRVELSSMFCQPE